MPNTYACKGVSNPNVPIFLPRVCTLVLFIILMSYLQIGLLSNNPFFLLPLFSSNSTEMLVSK